MDKTAIINIAKTYAKLVTLHFTPIEIILYGYYAKGTATEESDIDIAIVVSNLTGDYLDQASKLYQLRRSIDYRIQPILLEEATEKSGFLEDVRKIWISYLPRSLTLFCSHFWYNMLK